VHQFGGATPRRRPREGAQGQQPEQSSLQALMSLLPMLLLFIVPLISSIFSGSSSPAAGVSWSHDKAEPPLTQERATPKYNLKYFVDPTEIQSYSDAKLEQLDLRVEQDIVRKWTIECENQMAYQQRLFDRAQGFIFQDPVAMKVAKEYEAISCKKLEQVGLRRAR
jgi:DnaJ family protein B protein 12